MKVDRFTWGGLSLVVIGWVVLLAALLISDATLKAGSLVAVMALRGDILTIAESAILSGFGLAIIGTLRSGFGAFTRFFDAVLQRSAAPKRADPVHVDPMPVPTPQDDPPPPPRPSEPEVITIMPNPVADEPERPRTPRIKPAKPKNYAILPDGSVEVETMFGTRVFATMEEAKDFIH